MSTVGENLLLFEYPHGTEHPHGAYDIPHGTQITKDGILHGTQDIPHMHHDIPTVLHTR